MTFTCATTLLYLKITGPYCVLVKSKSDYVDYYKYVQKSDSFLEQCSYNPCLLFDISVASAFRADISFKSHTYFGVHNLAEKCEKAILQKVIVSVVKEIGD